VLSTSHPLLASSRPPAGPARHDADRFWLHVGVLAVFLLSTTLPAFAQEPPQTAAGRACIERWIQEVSLRLNGFDGDASFNSNKPWRINQYGLFAARNLGSAYEPDDWAQYGADKYRWMWGHYTTELALPDWNDGNFNAARLAGLRWFVRQCLVGALGDGAGGGAAGGSGGIPGGGFAGTWSCAGRGTLYVWQDGTDITGRFDWSGGGTISGSAYGGNLQAGYRLNDGRTGTWDMNLGAAGARIDGTWAHSTGGGGQWGCTRSSAPTPPAPDLPTGRGFTGSWSCPGRGTLTLRVEGSRVAATYDWSGGGTASGTVSGRDLRADWRLDDGRSGTWTVTLSPDGSRFDGSFTVASGGGGDWGCTRR